MLHLFSQRPPSELAQKNTPLGLTCRKVVLIARLIPQVFAVLLYIGILTAEMFAKRHLTPFNDNQEMFTFNN